MKLVSYRKDGLEAAGILFEDREEIFPLASGSEDPMLELIRNGLQDRLREVREQADKNRQLCIPAKEVKLLSPIPRPRDMLCIGFNYQDHAKEAAAGRGEVYKQNEEPIYFYKRTYEATTDGDVIPFDKDLAFTIGRGVEVVAVIGKDALNVSRENALDYVLGYSIINDLCDTAVNRRYGQPMLGKSLDGYMPVGPWIVTADEFEKDHIWHLRLKINDQVRADDTSVHMCFDIPYIISQLSTCMTLPAGTLIATGSPGESEADNKYRPVPGDTIVCSIDGLGSLTQTVTDTEDRKPYSNKEM